MDDNYLWKMAKARVEFKAHFRKFLLVNLLLWAIWLMVNISNKSPEWSFPWPIYVTLAWGLVLFLHYYRVYMKGVNDPVKKEFEKLKKIKDESEKK